MLKLMKYEFRKQWVSKVVILAILGILECAFLFGEITHNQRVLGLSMGLFSFLIIGATLYVSFECIFTYSNDLKTKQSYMLFLTPNSTYSIVGAKVLASVVQILLTLAAFAFVFISNIGFLMVRYNQLDELIKTLRKTLNVQLNTDIDLPMIISVITLVGLSWVRVVLIAMLAITLSATFLANNKLKGFVSVAFFFVLTFILSKFDDLLFPTTLTQTSDYISMDSFILLTIGIVYLATSYMLDKKVSV